MLEVQDVSTFYGPIRALEHVTPNVNAGEIVSIIGANGAGKTTLLNTISGLLHPRRGEIHFEGRRITYSSAEDIVALGISHIPERRQVFGTMSVLGNLLGAYHR